ncbi:MAG: hypothetical protein HY842_18500 [Bacteroidetes bacterium]|nr:hypothetical protein [Bacteroidota bacterium]
MKNYTLTLCFLLFTLISFGQHALSGSVMLRASQQKYEYSLSNDNEQHVYTGNINETKAPLLDLSILVFNEKGNFNKWSASGWHFNRSEDYRELYEDSTNLQYPEAGADLIRVGGGVRYVSGWQVKKVTENLSLFVTAFASGHYQYIENTPKTSQGYPINVNAVNMEFGVGFHAQRSFGDTWFVTLGIPVPFYEAGFYRISFQNPLFSWEESLQKTWYHNLRFWERTGLEIGAGFYLRVMCKK